jgi:hypothetical protein
MFNASSLCTSPAGGLSFCPREYAGMTAGKIVSQACSRSTKSSERIRKIIPVNSQAAERERAGLGASMMRHSCPLPQSRLVLRSCGVRVRLRRRALCLMTASGHVNSIRSKAFHQPPHPRQTAFRWTPSSITPLAQRFVTPQAADNADRGPAGLASACFNPRRAHAHGQRWRFQQGGGIPGRFRISSHPIQATLRPSPIPRG